MSISNEDINNNHVKTLSINVSHVIRYVEAMIPKDKKTIADIYPVEMHETQKDYIVNHLQYIYDNLMKR